MKNFNNFKVDYDKVSQTYDTRYQSNNLEKIGDKLLQIFAENNYTNVLEVGCGTGHWLKILEKLNINLFGLDYSLGMLLKAKKKKLNSQLICADADSIPIHNKKFDLIYCINSIHHFGNKKLFITNVKKLISSCGKLFIIGVDPREENDKWYMYDYFEDIYQKDLIRFPSWQNIIGWMKNAGFNNINLESVNKIRNDKYGDEVLTDPWLQKNGTSQLALLSEDIYKKGLAKINAALKTGSGNSSKPCFPVRLTIKMVSGTIS